MPYVEDMFERPESDRLGEIFLQYSEAILRSSTMAESLQKLVDVARMVPRPVFARSIASDLVEDLQMCPDFSLEALTRAFFEPPLAILFEPAMDHKLEHLHTIYRSYLDEPQARYWFSQEITDFIGLLEGAKTHEHIAELMNNAVGSVKGVQDLVLLATGIRSGLLRRLSDPASENEYSDFFWAFARAVVMVHQDDWVTLQKLLEKQAILPQSVIVLAPTTYFLRDPIPPIRGPVSIVGTWNEPDPATEDSDYTKTIVVIKHALRFEGPACLYNLEIRYTTQRPGNVCVILDAKREQFPSYKTLEVRHVELSFGGLRFSNGVFLDIQDLAVNVAHKGLEVRNTGTVYMSTRANCRDVNPLANTTFFQCNTAYVFTEVGAVHMRNQSTERCQQIFDAGYKLVQGPDGWKEVTGILHEFEIISSMFYNAEFFGVVRVLNREHSIFFNDSMVSLRNPASKGFRTPSDFFRDESSDGQVMPEEPLHVPAHVVIFPRVFVSGVRI